MRLVHRAESERAPFTRPADRYVHVNVDQRPAGLIVMADEPRPAAQAMTRRAEGIRHVALVTGDRASVARRVAAQLGVDRVYAEQTPEDKLTVVRRLHADPELGPVVMVGDGINDALGHLAPLPERSCRRTSTSESS